MLCKSVQFSPVTLYKIDQPQAQSAVKHFSRNSVFKGDISLYLGIEVGTRSLRRSAHEQAFYIRNRVVIPVAAPEDETAYYWSKGEEE